MTISKKIQLLLFELQIAPETCQCLRHMLYLMNAVWQLMTVNSRSMVQLGSGPINSPFYKFIPGIARGVLWWGFPPDGVMMLTRGRNVDKNPGFPTYGIEDTQTPRAVSIPCGVDTLNVSILFPRYFSFHNLCFLIACHVDFCKTLCSCQCE